LEFRNQRFGILKRKVKEMMNCSEAKELIQLYLDNELDARNTLEAQQHLEACPSCTRILDYFIKQDQTLKQFAKSETDDQANLRENILVAIRQQSATSHQEPNKGRIYRMQSWLQSPAFRRIAAVLVIAMVAAFFLLRGGLNEKVYADVVADHNYCTLDKLSKTVSDSAQIDKLCAEYGKLNKAPDLSAFGFANVRAKICGVEQVKILHLIYQSESQKPLSLFLRLHDTRMIADELVLLKREDYEIASFCNAGVDWFVVSSLDEKQTSAIARTLAESL
jgi:anti-sigma factor RsiW